MKEIDHNIFAKKEQKEKEKKELIANLEVVGSGKFTLETTTRKEIDDINLRLFIKEFPYKEEDIRELHHELEYNVDGNVRFMIPIKLIKLAVSDKKNVWYPSVYVATQMIRNQSNRKVCSLSRILDLLGYAENTQNYKNVKKALVFFQKKGYCRFTSNGEFIDIESIGRNELFQTVKGFSNTQNLLSLTSHRMKYLFHNSSGLNQNIMVNTYLYCFLIGADNSVILGTVDFFKNEAGVSQNETKLKLLKKFIELDLMYVVTGGNIKGKKGRFFTTPYFIGLPFNDNFVKKVCDSRDYYCMRAEENGCVVYFEDVDTHCNEIDREYKSRLSYYREKRKYYFLQDGNGSFDFEQLNERIQEIKKWRESYVKGRSEDKYRKEHPYFGEGDSVDIKYKPSFLTKEIYESIKHDHTNIQYYQYIPQTKKE